MSSNAQNLLFPGRLAFRDACVGSGVTPRCRGVATRGAVTTFISLALCTAAFGADRLESVERDLTVTELHRASHAIWSEKVLVRGAMVQCVSVPAGAGREIGISILRNTERSDSKRPRFDLIVKEASSSLWSVVIAKHEGAAKLSNVAVKTCKIPLPESTALAIYRALLAMLEQIAPAPDQLGPGLDTRDLLGKESSG